jgi:hypothetical protein
VAVESRESRVCKERASASEFHVSSYSEAIILSSRSTIAVKRETRSAIGRGSVQYSAPGRLRLVPAQDVHRTEQSLCTNDTAVYNISSVWRTPCAQQLMAHAMKPRLSCHRSLEHFQTAVDHGRRTVSCQPTSRRRPKNMVRNLIVEARQLSRQLHAHPCSHSHARRHVGRRAANVKM